jgi:hypothetical protein
MGQIESGSPKSPNDASNSSTFQTNQSSQCHKNVVTDIVPFLFLRVELKKTIQKQPAKRSKQTSETGEIHTKKKSLLIHDRLLRIIRHMFHRHELLTIQKKTSRGVSEYFPFLKGQARSNPIQSNPLYLIQSNHRLK